MKYDAFISYRHLEKDMYVAKKVHKALETTKIPRKIQKETGKKKIQRVFRDQEELPIGSDLGNNIEYALSESGFLIVICSPETQKSYWVMKEIDTFISTHGRDNVLAVLVEGEPGDSFPPQLLTDENGNPVEPLAADVRGNTKREIDKKIKVETMRLAASILHCDYDDLRQRHRERIVRRNMTIASGVAVLGVAFGVYNAYNLARINENYQQKLINESKVIASTSLNVLEAGDRKTAALIALEGLPKEGNDRPLVIDGVYALSRALGSYSLGDELTHDAKLSHHLPVKEFVYSSNGKYVLSYDNGEDIYFWDLETAGLLFEKRGEYIDGSKDEVRAIGVQEDNPVVLTTNYLSRYDKDGGVVYQIQLDKEATGGVVNKGESTIAVCYSDEIEIFNLDTGKSVASFKNPNENSFSGRNVIISEELGYVAVDYLDDDDDITGVLLINTKTGEMITLKTYCSSVMDMNFTADGCLAVSNMREDDLLAMRDAPIYVEKYELSKGDVLFSREYEYDSSSLNMSYSQLKSRVFNDGTEHAELLLTACKVMYTLDLYTGDVIAKYTPDSDIEAINIAINGAIAYVGTVNGDLIFVNGSTGVALSDYTTRVADSIIRMQAGFSRVIVKSYRSSELTVMSYIKDDTVEEMATLDFTYHVDQAMSPDESSLAITYSNYPEGKVVIFDTATGENIGSIEVERVSSEGLKYIDEDTLEFSDSAGNIYKYSISKKETNVISVGADADMTTSIVSRNGRYFLYGTGSGYMVVDAFEGKEVYSGKTTDDYDKNLSMNEKVILSDASKFFFTNYSSQLFVVDQAGAPQEVIPEQRVLQVKLSYDDKYLLAACADGFLRVVDVESLEVVHEVDYYGTSTSFMDISMDGSKLFLQGADLFLKVYDLNSGDFLFASDDRIEDIYSVDENPGDNIVAFRTTAAMYFVDTDDHGFIAKADNGIFYMSKQNSIISLLKDKMYRFKFKSLDDLRQEVTKQFGETGLTEEQRRKYKLN